MIVRRLVSLAAIGSLAIGVAPVTAAERGGASTVSPSIARVPATLSASGPASPAPEPASPTPGPTSSTTPVPAGPTPTASSALPSPATSPAGASPTPQAYATFVKKAERQSGLIDLLKKDDDVYFDLGADQLDRPFIVSPVLASGVGADASAGRVYPSFLLEFKRVGKRVLWIEKNADFAAPPNSPAASALAISVTDSVINSTPIAAEDEASKRVVVSAAFFLTDFESIGRDLGGRAPGLAILGGPSLSRFSVDTSKSYLERTKALPKNDEILANLAFSGPPGDLSGAPDGRGVRLRMHYSIVEAGPTDAYVPRLADDRVGYFITAHKRFDDDASPSPFVRYIDRWNFKRGPIVYYLTNEIPTAYRPAIRDALLTWNDAFARVGVPNAIEVRDQPDDPAWDPDDARYSTVRWITSDKPSFAAYGPHVADPRTGEILRVEIVIDGEALRSVKRGYVDQVVPSRVLTRDASGLPAAARDPRASVCDGPAACDTFAADSAELAATGSLALHQARATPQQTERYAQEWLRSVVLHESGHNFGLRHNFISATLFPLAKLHDAAFTRDHGLVGSVMGYTPTNVSPPGVPQGSYFQRRLGPYDYWAIRYGYATFPNVRTSQDERVPLRGIAVEGSQPRYAYATDEDARGPLAVDPRVATFHLSSDPLAFDASQFALVDALARNLDRTYPRDDRPYAEERATFATLLRTYERAARLASLYIGGVYTSRDHRGQPGGSSPLRVVPRTESRRAFDLLARHVFSSQALRFSPHLLADLGSNHFLHRGVDRVDVPDYPVTEAIATLQDDVLYAMFSPDAMTRLTNAAYKARPGERAMSLDDLFTWTQGAVWDDLQPGIRRIDTVHRGLQRRYTNLLVAYALAPSFVLGGIGYPSDTASLASYELRHLAPAIDVALRSPSLDVATRAHLEDVRSRIRHALDAGAVRGA
ncbi:MAG: zinc-dependent metalloprotease [Vulcanimicrobiaceae bacterium]